MLMCLLTYVPEFVWPTNVISGILSICYCMLMCSFMLMYSPDKPLSFKCTTNKLKTNEKILDLVWDIFSILYNNNMQWKCVSTFQYSNDSDNCVKEIELVKMFGIFVFNISTDRWKWCPVFWSVRESMIDAQSM